MNKYYKDHLDSSSNIKISRRNLLKKFAVNGMSVSALAPIMVESTETKKTNDFNWGKHKGNWINILLVKHPYTTALIDHLSNFKLLTGINIRYKILSERQYFKTLDRELHEKSSEFDVVMTGAYMTWLYGPQGKFVDLNAWIKNPEKTNPDYDWNDFIPSVRSSCAWNGIPGSELGTSDAKQWCVPWGYEQNNLSYNSDILNNMSISVPQNLDELIDTCKQITHEQPDLIGIGLRGTKHWNTIHSGFLSAYANYGERDFRLKSDGKLVAAMNTRGSREFHQKWVDLIRAGCGGTSKWSQNTWYGISSELSNRRSAMMYDADILGFGANSSVHPSAGQIGYSPFVANPDAHSTTPNIWIWALAISQFSSNKDTAWYFVQWATGKSHGLYGAINRDFVNPVRKSVWMNARFKSRLEDKYPGYFECHESSVDGSAIKFTAQPAFFSTTTEWAASLQKMVMGIEPVDESLEKLSNKINIMLEHHNL